MEDIKPLFRRLSKYLLTELIEYAIPRADFSKEGNSVMVSYSMLGDVKIPALYLFFPDGDVWEYSYDLKTGKIREAGLLGTARFKEVNRLRGKAVKLNSLAQEQEEDKVSEEEFRQEF